MTDLKLTPVKGPKGMNRCLEKLAATRSPLKKQQILRQYDSPMLRKVLVYALHPRKVYGIAKLRPELGTSGTLLEPPKLKDFCDLLDCLNGRTITGHDAHKNVNAYLQASPDWSDVFKCMVLKDLDCGLQVTSVNKVFKGLIPRWKVMKGEDYEDYADKIKPPFLAEIKWDGHRTTCFGESGSFITTGGLEKKGYSVVKQELYDFVQYIRAVYPDRWPVLDGELMVGMFGSRSKQEANAGYVIFDLVWQHQLYDPDAQLPQITRTELLKSLFEGYLEVGGQATRIRLGDSRLIKTQDELDLWYDQVIAEGHEGLMIKKLDAKWVPKRSQDWLKYKVTYTEDLTIIDVFEGEEDKKYVGMLGGVIVRHKLSKLLRKKLGIETKYVDVRAGGGFSDEQRKEWWEEDKGQWLIGWTAEIEFKSYTPKGSLRHPQFVRLRDDK